MRVSQSAEFVRQVERLARRYPHVTVALRALIADLISGKSGGFQVIYLLATDEGAIFLAIYTKTDQADLPRAELRELIKVYLAG